MCPPVASDKIFAGSIPQIYERYLVPLIFQPYAQDLAHRVTAAEPQNVLETAAGTGVLTRALAARLAASARLIASDLNEPMLEEAKASLADDHHTIEFRQADAMALPFADRSFDAVACQFGAMFFPDKVKAYREARRVLKPDGVFVLNVWDRISENEFADVTTQALAEVFTDDPPRFLARTPHGYHDPECIRSDLKSAGFETIDLDLVAATSKAPSPLHPAVAYCQGTPLRSEIEHRDPALLEEATHHAAAALARRFGDGAVEGRIRGWVVTAKARPAAVRD